MMGRSLPPVRSTHSGIVHAVAQCDDCGWTADGYKNATGLGNQHARRYGHTVHIEQCIAITYNRK